MSCLIRYLKPRVPGLPRATRAHICCPSGRVTGTSNHWAWGLQGPGLSRQIACLMQLLTWSQVPSSLCLNVCVHLCSASGHGSPNPDLLSCSSPPRYLDLHMPPSPRFSHKQPLAQGRCSVSICELTHRGLPGQGSLSRGCGPSGSAEVQLCGLLGWRKSPSVQ